MEFDRAKNLGKYSMRIPICIDNLTKTERAYLIGAFLGDGCSYDGFDMQVKDKDFADYVASLISKITAKNIIAKKYSRIRQNFIETGYRVRASNKNLEAWFQRTTKNKYNIPKLNSENEVMNFLSGFFDAEGCIKYGGNSGTAKTSLYMQISQKNGDLLYQLQKLLKKYRINSSINYYTQKNVKYHNLNIYNKNNFRKILSKGNIIIQRKKRHLVDYVNGLNFQKRSCENYRKYSLQQYRLVRRLYSNSVKIKSQRGLKRVSNGSILDIVEKTGIPYGTIEKWIYCGWKNVRDD